MATPDTDANSGSSIVMDCTSSINPADTDATLPASTPQLEEAADNCSCPPTQVLEPDDDGAAAGNAAHAASAAPRLAAGFSRLPTRIMEEDDDGDADMDSTLPATPPPRLVSGFSRLPTVVLGVDNEPDPKYNVSLGTAAADAPSYEDVRRRYITCPTPPPPHPPPVPFFAVIITHVTYPVATFMMRKGCLVHLNWARYDHRRRCKTFTAILNPAALFEVSC